MDTTHRPQSDLSDLVRRVRRHWWVAAVCAVAGIAGAAVFTSHQPRVYESATSVLVQATGTGQDSSVVGGRTKGDLNLDTEAQLVRSTAVSTGAATLLRDTTPPESLAARVSVDVPANTSVLVITFAAPSARRAQAGSHAFAESYLRNREDTATADLANQMATVDAKLKQLTAALAQINVRLAALDRGRTDRANPDRANLDSQRSTAVSQINTLSGRMNQLATTTVNTGRIIREADLPVRPSRPNLPLNLASGAMLGLLLGVGLSLLRERFDRRVRRAADLPRRTDVPVLATLPSRVKPSLDDVFLPFGAGGRTFHRLRNEVLASLPPQGPAEPDQAGQPGQSGQSGQPGQPGQPARVVVVAGASRGPAATVVAANLASAFARTGSETILLAAHLPDGLVDTAPVTRLLGVAAVPGLSDVLAGGTELAEAMQRAPRQPWLRVITTGGAASAGGLLQSQALGDMLATLRTEARYVVIEAPSTAASADAQSLAGLADAALLVVEQRRTRYTEVVDAADQLRRVGTPVLGAVVLPRPRIEPRAAAPVEPDASVPVEPDAASTAVNRPSPNGGRPKLPHVEDATMVLARLDLTGEPADTDRVPDSGA